MLVGAVGSLPMALRKARGSPVDPNVSALTSSLTAASFAFDADGVATDAVALHAANAAGDPLAGKVATVVLAAKTVSASLSSVTVTPDTIPDDDASVANILVTLLNEDGDPVVGVPAANISVVSDGTGNTIAAASAVTDRTGLAVFTIRSSVAEVKTITVTALDLALDDEPTVTVENEVPPTHPNEPSGYVEVIAWDDEATLAPTGWTYDAHPSSPARVTTREGSGIPWTPTHGGTAYIHKHQDGGIAGGSGSGRLEHAFASAPSAIYVMVEGYLPVDAALSDNSNKFFSITFGDGAGGKELLVSGRVAVDGASARPGDDMWRIAPESGFASGAAIYNGIVPFAYGSAQIHELLVIPNSGVGVADGVVRHWVNGVLNVEVTDLEFPEGVDISRLKVEGVNNGNHSPGPSDPRLIALADGTAHDADWYLSYIYVSEAP